MRLGDVGSVSERLCEVKYGWERLDEDGWDWFRFGEAG